MEQLRLGEDGSLVTLKQAWDKALKLLAQSISRPSFDGFVKNARPLSFDGANACIGASNELARIFLEKYSEIIKTAIDSTLDSSVNLSFVIAPPEQAKPRPAEGKERETRKRATVVSSVSLPLNDKYIFSNFIVGASNRMAHAVGEAVAHKPGEVYNPVFFYGGPGLGKTHLLQAVGHAILERHPELRVAYVSGERFTSHYVAALREHKSEEFRRMYRNIDVWLVDDVQFLVGKERTKEEFFHTFNTLYQTNKQIILSSDRSPRDLNPMEDRLRSRFESGIVTDIAPPDLEMRIAILQNKASQEQADIPMPILEFVAETIQTNIRALEGALVTMIAYSSLMKAELSIPLVQEVLGRYLSEKKRAELTTDAVQRAVAKTFSVEFEDIVGQKRQKELVAPRHVAMYLCRELTDATLPAIGRAFGGRNHTTVLHACGKVKDSLEDDTELRDMVDRITRDLKSGVC